MNRLRLSLGLLFMVFLLTACPYSVEPYEPPNLYDYTGTWTGTVKDSNVGEGDLVVTITLQSEGGTLGGEWQTDFGEVTAGGVFRGNLYGYDSDEVTLSFVLAPVTNCVLEVTAVREEDELSATYAPSLNLPSDCTGAPLGVGTFLIKKAAEESS